MAESSGGDRTERATPKRRREARDKGQVARSMEVNGAIILLTGITMLLLSSGHLARVLQTNATYLFAQAHALEPDNLLGVKEILVGNISLLLKALAPLVLALFIAGFGANVLQVGFHASAEALAFRAEKLNPITGIKRFFGKKAAFELVKNLVKILLIAVIGYHTVRGLLPDLLGSPLFPLTAILSLGKVAFAKLMFKLLALMILLALVDWVFQKWQYEQNLKMTKVETKQEAKDTEGDPQVKARMRAVQLEAYRQRMLAAVPTADVVVTNPDHLAVALKYEQGAPAPVVVAKGRNHLAEKIKKIARKTRVPILENKPLARALFPLVKVGEMIPESLYQVVAEVLAYVYGLRKS